MAARGRGMGTVTATAVRSPTSRRQLPRPLLPLHISFLLPLHISPPCPPEDWGRSVQKPLSIVSWRRLNPAPMTARWWSSARCFWAVSSLDKNFFSKTLFPSTVTLQCVTLCRGNPRPAGEPRGAGGRVPDLQGRLRGEEAVPQHA